VAGERAEGDEVAKARTVYDEMKTKPVLSWIEP
jgi:hypothetical protein